MAKAAKTATENQEIKIFALGQQQVTFYIVGDSPMIFNRMAEKAKRELLFPSGGRRTAADRAGTLKHEPVSEYRDSVYRHHGDDVPTRLKLPAPCFKGAMMTAALDLPGTRRTEIGRLVWVKGTHVDIYGVPSLFMNGVRSADLAHTPDIRTRAVCARWACQVTVAFVTPKLTPTAVYNLLRGAGMVSGVGDFRQEKGKGNYGQFRVVDQDDEEYLFLTKNCGREAQDLALYDDNVPTFDEDSQDLLDWFHAEFKRRREAVTEIKVDKPAEEAKPRKLRAVAAKIKTSRRKAA
jgi:hypothetical protein